MKALSENSQTKMAAATRPQGFLVGPVGAAWGGVGEAEMEREGQREKHLSLAAGGQQLVEEAESAEVPEARPGPDA